MGKPHKRSSPVKQVEANQPPNADAPWINGARHTVRHHIPEPYTSCMLETRGIVMWVSDLSDPINPMTRGAERTS